MDGPTPPKKARVKSECDARLVNLQDSNVFDVENDSDQSPTDCGDSSSGQYEGIDSAIEYSEETYPVAFPDVKIKAESLKSANTQFILCQPNETVETVKNSWTHSMTNILIEEYRKMLSEFQDPNKKQKDMWIKLAENMCHRGCDVTWDMCDQKWRNLKHTFKSIYFNKHRSEKSKRRWDFYQPLEDVFVPQLNAESLQKAAIASSNFPTENSSTPKPDNKKCKMRIDSAYYPSQLAFETSSGTFTVCEGDRREAGEENSSGKETVPPHWFQDFVKQYREVEDRRISLVKEMHNDLLQVERRKCAALEALAMKFSQQ